jgi:hypothetical protein
MGTVIAEALYYSVIRVVKRKCRLTVDGMGSFGGQRKGGVSPPRGLGREKATGDSHFAATEP